MRLRLAVLALLFAALGSCRRQRSRRSGRRSPRRSRSPAASVAQTVGVTRIEIDYARAAVKGRKVWGELVPYGEVWRAGANINTTIDGVDAGRGRRARALPAGTYGLHMLPTEKEWTVILSRDAVRWGSFGYDEKHDAARFTIDAVRRADDRVARSTRSTRSTTTRPKSCSPGRSVRAAFPIQVDTQAETIAALEARPDRSRAVLLAALEHGGELQLQQQGRRRRRARPGRDVDRHRTPNFINSQDQGQVPAAPGDARRADALVAEALGDATEQEINAVRLRAPRRRQDEPRRSRSSARTSRTIRSRGTSYDSLGETLLAGSEDGGRRHRDVQEGAVDGAGGAEGADRRDPRQGRRRRSRAIAAGRSGPRVGRDRLSRPMPC